MHQTWEMDNAVIFGAMWNEASKALQREKDQGYRSKQITDKDVEAMVGTMFPDEWRAQEVRRLRAKHTEKSLEHLVEMWGSKCRSLNTLVGKGR
jgi:dsRNA-specific ribonuclease